MRCPNCGALNPDAASWCSLCFQRFDDKNEQQDPAPPAEQETIGEVHPVSPEAPVDFLGATAIPSIDLADPLGEQTTTVRRGLVKEGEEVVGWLCPKCEHRNVMETNVCVVCGTSLFSVFQPETPPKEFAAKNPAVAAALSIIPGAGHLYLDRIGEAVARLSLAFWWMGAVVGLRTSGALAILRIVFALASVALVGLSAYDAYRQASDPNVRPALSRKVMLYATLGLVGFSTIGALFLLVTARG